MARAKKIAGCMKVEPDRGGKRSGEALGTRGVERGAGWWMSRCRVGDAATCTLFP